MNFSPIVARLADGTDEATLKKVRSSAPIELHLDTLEIYGHRLFGLSPSEPTYVCNWDLNFGLVSGQATPNFVRTLIFSIKAFLFTFDDLENALPAEEEIINDATFLRLSVKSIHVQINEGTAGWLISSESIRLMFNDWSSGLISDVISLVIPDLLISCVDNGGLGDAQKNTSSNVSGESKAMKPHARFSTNIFVSVFGQKALLKERRDLQQKHIHDHDLKTRRTSFLLHETSSKGLFGAVGVGVEVAATSMSIPSMPPPIQC